MATHSSILAWEIPRTEEPSGLQSMRPQRVGRKHSFCFPGGSISKESAGNAGALGLIPGSGRSPGGGQGNPLQYSCLENPMDRGAWWATVRRVTKSQTRLKQFSTHTLACLYRTSSALRIVYMSFANIIVGIQK